MFFSRKHISLVETWASHHLLWYNHKDEKMSSSNRVGKSNKIHQIKSIMTSNGWPWKLKVQFACTSSRGQPCTIQLSSGCTTQLRWLLLESISVSDAGHIFSSAPRRSLVLSSAGQSCSNASNSALEWQQSNFISSAWGSKTSGCFQAQWCRLSEGAWLPRSLFDLCVCEQGWKSHSPHLLPSCLSVTGSGSVKWGFFTVRPNKLT